MLLILITVGCSEETYELWIDNPSTQDLNISVNDSNYVIFGFDMLVLELKEGNYLFRGNNENNSLNFSQVQTINSDGILNPTLQTYVLWTDVYGTTELKLRARTDTINGHKYKHLKLERLDGFFIPKKWDYSLFEDWKKQLNYHSISYIEKSKIYRLKDFEKTWGFQNETDDASLTLQKINNKLQQLKKQLKTLIDAK
ncbi:MAG: hypothetical protein ACPHXR_01940 [Flavicella sp.]